MQATCIFVNFLQEQVPFVYQVHMKEVQNTQIRFLHLGNVALGKISQYGHIWTYSPDQMFYKHGKERNVTKN